MHQNEPSTGSQYQPGDVLPANYTTKRPPTPPKSKQPSLPTGEQHRAPMHIEGHDYQCRPPGSFQSTIMNKSTFNKSSNNNCSKHTKNQLLPYQSQIASETNKNCLQPPSLPPSPSVLQNEPLRHLDEFFILQEQMNRIHRHCDQLVEENGVLKYHLHVLQYRLQAIESICYDYYCNTTKRDSWSSTHSHHSQWDQTYQCRPWIQSDQVTESPPIPPSLLVSHFMAPLPSSRLSNNSRSILVQQKNDDSSRHGRFRLPRSKSLSRNTSFSSVPADNNSDNDYFLQQQNFLFPPPPPTFRPVPTMYPHFQHFERSVNVPPYIRRHFPSNDINDSNNNSDTDDDDNESNSVDDQDDDNLSENGVHSQQRRYSRHHRYKSAKTVDSSSPPPHQVMNSNLSMGLPPSMTEIPFGYSYDAYSANGDDDDEEGDNNRDGGNGWYYNSTGDMRHQQHRFDYSTNYP